MKKEIKKQEKNKFKYNENKNKNKKINNEDIDNVAVFLEKRNWFSLSLIYLISRIISLGIWIFFISLGILYYIIPFKIFENKSLCFYIMSKVFAFFLSNTLLDHLPHILAFILGIIFMIVLFFLLAILIGLFVPIMTFIGIPILKLFKWVRIDVINEFIKRDEKRNNRPHIHRMNGKRYFKLYINKLNNVDLNQSDEDLFKEFAKTSYSYQKEHGFEADFEKEDEEFEDFFNEYEKYNENITSEIDDYSKAKLAFYLDDDNYTLDEIKKIRNRLIKACHSDNNSNDELSKNQSIKINNYYEILKKHKN